MGHLLSTPLTSKFITRESKFGIRVGTCEMQGWRIDMEDAMTVKLGLSERHPNVCLAGVFDGHAGDRASAFLSANLANKISELSDPTDSAQLSAATLAIDADFLASCPTQDLKDHGSTCVFAVFYPIHDQGETDDSKKRWHVKVCNVGDSRAMILRQDGTCVSLTKDHKPQDDKEKERIEKCNGFVRDNRVDGQLAMSRAIGDWQYKRNLAFTVAEQKVIPVPDITEDTVCCGDFLFICCDGIVEHMSNEDACNVIKEVSCTPTSVCSMLSRHRMVSFRKVAADSKNINFDTR